MLASCVGIFNVIGHIAIVQHVGQTITICQREDNRHCFVENMKFDEFIERSDGSRYGTHLNKCVEECCCFIVTCVTEIDRCGHAICFSKVAECITGDNTSCKEGSISVFKLCKELFEGFREHIFTSVVIEIQVCICKFDTFVFGTNSRVLISQRSHRILDLTDSCGYRNILLLAFVQHLIEPRHEVVCDIGVTFNNYFVEV